MKNNSKGPTSQIFFGFVTQSLNENGFGIVVVDDFAQSGRARSFGIMDKIGPHFVYEGVSTPCFEGTFIERLPSRTDSVVLEVSGVNGDMKVVGWGYANDWQKAERSISLRPWYRVVRDDYSFDGKSLGKKFRDQIVFEGNLREMCMESYRDGLPDSVKDKFAPVYRNAVFMSKNRFELRKPDGSWVSHDDPRPFPATGPMYRLMYRKNGVDAELAYGQALAINYRFPRGDKDPLAKYIAEETSSGGYLYWLRQESASYMVDPKKGMVFSKEMIWTETNDPRPLPEKLKPTKVVTSDDTAQYSAKFAPRQLNLGGKFRTEMRSLEQLSLA